MERASPAKKVFDLVSSQVSFLGYELVEVEYLSESGRWVLRLYIDKEGGVGLEDCTKVSRSVSALLDVEDVIPGKYNLEVSSPGVQRPIRKKEDFEKFKGSAARIKTHRKIGDRKNFRGVLQGVDGEKVLIAVDGQNFEIPINDILKARLQEA